MNRLRPPRTEAHAVRDRLLIQFQLAGLQPILSTNGSNPEADIQVIMTLLDEGGTYGEMLMAVLTERGAARLLGAQ